MIALLLLQGCAQHLFPTRAIPCEGIRRLEVDAPRDLLIRITEEEGCEIRASSGARFSIEGDVLMLSRVDYVEVQGPSEFAMSWEGSLEIEAPGAKGFSDQPGSLEVTVGGLSCEGCTLSLTAERTLGLFIGGGAEVSVCTSAGGFAQLDGAALDLSVQSGVEWFVTGSGTLSGHLLTPDVSVVVDSTVQSDWAFGDAPAFECCGELGGDCAFVEGDVDVDVDVDADSDADTDVEPSGNSCMDCHNQGVDYQGPGLEDPHPASFVDCVQCHGGNPFAPTAPLAHVPKPPAIALPGGAYDRRTLTGVDRLGSYTGTLGQGFTALDWLRFRNPGDLRVTSAGLSCGETSCHADIAERVARSPMATNVGLYGAAAWHTDQGADSSNDFGTEGVFAFRDVIGPVSPTVGVVAQLSGLDTTGAMPAVDANALESDVNSQNQVARFSPLDDLVQRATDGACGSCHLGSAGTNLGPGSFRSSGCTACHMPAALDGRITTTDTNLGEDPVNPDALTDADRIHVSRHRLVAVSQGPGDGGVPDSACGACHAGSSATYLEYQGIRVDLGRDLMQSSQYPSNPFGFSAVQLPYATYLGYQPGQLLLMEDYDADQRDDTPPDVHFQAGMGCIDCHIGVELHGPTSIVSHGEQATTVRCESCHGTVGQEPQTAPCPDFSGVFQSCAMDSLGNPLRHVRREPDGTFILRSKTTGFEHFIRLVKDVVVDNGVTDPTDSVNPAVFSPIGSFAMGEDLGFAHTETLECVACHAAWMTTCVSCHVEVSVGGNGRSSTSGQPLGVGLDADVGYGSPLFFTLGVGPRGKIQPFRPGTPTFFRFVDGNTNASRTFAFSDRIGNGNHPNSGGRGPSSAGTHSPASPHTIRGRVTPTLEGPRYCDACHLTADMDLVAYGDWVAGNADATPAFLTPNNSGHDPRFVRMAAGLGAGLYALSAEGCPLNLLDSDPTRAGCDGTAPADGDTDTPLFEIDRLVEDNGVSNASTLHPMLTAPSPYRQGALYPELAGPLGTTTSERLSDPLLGIVLDEWYDANGDHYQGVDPPPPPDP